MMEVKSFFMANKTSQKQLAANRRNALQSTGPRTAAGKSVSRLNAAKHGALARQVVARGRFQKESIDDFKTLCQEYHQSLAPEGPLEEMLVGQIVTVVWRLRRVRIAEAGEIAMNADAHWWSERQTPWEQGNGSKWNPLSTCMTDFRRTARGIGIIIDSLEELRDTTEKAGEVSDQKLKEYIRGYADPPNEIVSQLVKFNAQMKSDSGTLPAGELRTRRVKEMLAYLDEQIMEYEDLMLTRQKGEDAEDATRRAAAMLPDEEVVEKLVRYESALQRQLYRAMNQLERLQRRRLGETVPAPIALDISARA
jgi:hypothetical protein